jgi:hypothetical protein
MDQRSIVMLARLRAVIAATVLGLVIPIGGAVEAREVSIGSITYDGAPQREVINAGGEPFRSIRFEVRQNDVEVLDIRVVYDNGATEDIRVRQLFRAGGSSRNFDLSNSRRGVRQIIVNFVPKGPARLVFFGDGAGGGGGGNGGGDGDWSQLGCRDIRFLADRDTLKVGQFDRRFSAVRLKVRKAAVEVSSLRITFGNGSRQDVRVGELIPPGGTSRPITLDGGNRAIDRIEMMYRSIPTNKGTAEICVDGVER